MSTLKKLIFFMFLHLVSTRSQINLDLTNWVSNNGDNNIVLQHDCLHVAATRYNESDPQQIISYCMSEFPSKWNIEEYRFNEKFTFSELAKRNITSEELYRWSAPIDIIEDYQFYLNQLTTSKILSSMSTQLFYNCTSSTFGSLCQYSLDGYESSYLSLQDIIHDYYTYLYEPITLTCYTHLQCNYASNSICLDWRNICDQHVDCVDDGIDEKYCSQLQINECEADEYQCKDGYCIPKIFLVENDFAIECNDERNKFKVQSYFLDRSRREPTIIAEDTTCSKKHSASLSFLSACSTERGPLLLESIFLNKPDSVSDECWFTFRCYYSIPNRLHPRCRNICLNESCQSIIDKSCPDILYIPNIPILFGHIRIAYTKQHAVQSTNMKLKPSYICYNDQLCAGFLPNKSLLLFNNTTCRRPEDFPVMFLTGGRGQWMDTYISRIYDQLYRCNTVPQDIVTDCDSSTMYQCINSSKCISNNRVGNTIQDCDYNDDEQQEVINKVCANDKSGHFFNCTKCINRIKVENGVCDCEKDENGMCADEHSLMHYTTTHISFPSICDGFTELVPVDINGRYETDETECELWHCNNTYTRCDGFWNCLNGADEIGCNPSPLLNCSSQQICISPNMKELMCLPLAKVNDGIIDCLDATDEPNLCRPNNFIHDKMHFHCPNDPDNFCTWSRYLCTEIDTCRDDDMNNWFCLPNRNITVAPNNCLFPSEEIDSDVEKYLCEDPFKIVKELLDYYFSFDGVNPSIEKINAIETISPPKYGMKQRCQRGFPIRIWLNKQNNLTDITCLCPPSFYGNTCQYQNQRLRVTLKLLAYSTSRQTLFAIVIKLIDNSYEQIIHSHQQFTYLYVRDCKIKFNIYLLYSNRPKNETKQYSVRIDVYEKESLTHRTSFLIPVKFLFLPIQRVIKLISIPPNDGSDRSCSNQPCVHGQCLKYFNNMNNMTFCYCEEGWTGQYCNIMHTCSCSLGSLCIGVSANNQSICVCPINKFGPRCLLDNTICQSNRNETCNNDGKCIPIDEHLASEKKFFCICPKSFRGDRCEIFNTKITISFYENITLPLSMMVHFIQVMDNDLPSNGSTVTTISIKNKSAIIYWSNPFHIAFIKLLENNYYLIIVQKTLNTSTTISRTINPSDRCLHINEILNKSIAELRINDSCSPDTCSPDTCSPDSCSRDTCSPKTLAPHGHLLPEQLLPMDNCSSDSCSPRAFAPPTVARQEHLLPWQSFLQLLIRTSNNKTPITQVLNSDKNLHLTSIGLRPHPHSHLDFTLTHTWTSPSLTLGFRPHPHLDFALTRIFIHTLTLTVNPVDNMRATVAKEQVSLGSKCLESNCHWGASVWGATVWRASVIGEQVSREQLSGEQLSGEQHSGYPELHPLRRIKYYHVPCQNRTRNLSCFYDDTHFCLCTDFGDQRLANCFEFNYTKKFDCLGQSSCINGGECLEDKLTCPTMSLCMCPKCFYGAYCQFSSNGLGLSLDGILGYHIQPHIKITSQPVIVQISMALTIIMTIMGIVDGVLSIITFNSKNLQKAGCGFYLLGSSITTLFLTVIFALKFTILVVAQINYISNRLFLKVQCISIDFLLRIGLSLDQWLNACVAIERAITSIKGTQFNQTKSRHMAKYVIIILILFITITNIYDPFYRQIIDDGDDGEQRRIWCIVTYASGFVVLHSLMNILQFFVPFIINIISASIIILGTTRRRQALHINEEYRTILYDQIQQHKHLLIAPIVLIILAIPRLIISFFSGCMKSTDDAWLFLMGYFISFIPSMLTFVVFVLPSKAYKKEFLDKIKRYKLNIKRRLGIDS